jgi:hypothetical protein
MEEEERSVRQLHLQTLESHRLANQQMQMQQHLELQRLANEQMQMQQHLELQRLANEQMQMQQYFAHRQHVREVKLASFENIYTNKMQFLDAEIKNSMQDTQKHFDLQLEFVRLQHALHYELKQMQQKNNEEAQQDHAAYMAWCRQHNIQASQ